MKKCLVFHGICKIVPVLQHVLIYVQTTNYSSPVGGSINVLLMGVSRVQDCRSKVKNKAKTWHSMFIFHPWASASWCLVASWVTHDMGTVPITGHLLGESAGQKWSSLTKDEGRGAQKLSRVLAKLRPPPPPPLTPIWRQFHIILGIRLFTIDQLYWVNSVTERLQVKHDRNSI